MEFFKSIEFKYTAEELQKKIKIDSIDLIQDEIILIDKIDNEKAKVGTIWGEFTLHMISVTGGFRISLLECPNALSWTITTGLSPSPNLLMIHLTINKNEINDGFKEELEEFIQIQADQLKDIDFSL